ncbi:MAG: hypothetical protein H5T50_01290 [Nitrososphaeria archaeon]|nr:hypothetical protein [Nitrososphaeria archaeon]
MRKIFLITLVAVFIVTLFFSNLNAVHALSPSQVRAGIWVISVDKVDLASGTFP